MKPRSWFTAGAAGLLALAVPVTVLVVRRTPRTPERTGPPVQAAVRSTLEVATEASGLLQPVRTVEVKSRASGEVLEVTVETGDRVEVAALLARIDPRDVENAFQQAQADLAAARVRARTTATQRARMEALRKDAVATQQEYEAAISAAATAHAEFVRAQTNLQLASERRADAIIRAPIAGTIIERQVEVGQIIASATSNVSGGTVLFKMADLTTMQVRAKVNEIDIGSVAAGQEATVTVEAYAGRPFRGQVYRVEPQSVVEQNVTLFPVLIRLDNADGLLRPGMNAEVTIQVARREDVVTIPNGAVVTVKDARAAGTLLGIPDEALSTLRDGGGRRSPPVLGDGVRPGVVFVRQGEAIEPRRVSLGLFDWDRTEVVSGVEPGDEVVMVSLAQLERQKQQMTDRIRRRTGLPGTSGGGSGGGGRGRAPSSNSGGAAGPSAGR